MRNRQFRFAYFTPKYEGTLAFYREGLGLPVFDAWDRTPDEDRKSTRLNSSHSQISYAVFCLNNNNNTSRAPKSQRERARCSTRLLFMSTMDTPNSVASSWR